MCPESPLESLVRCWSINKRIKKDTTLLLGQKEGFVLRDRLASGLCYGGYTKIGDFAPFKLCGSFDERLCSLVDTETKPLIA
jgi:hypothetical protein